MDFKKVMFGGWLNKKDELEYEEDTKNDFDGEDIYEEDEEIYSNSETQNYNSTRNNNNVADKVINMNIKKSLHFRMFKPTDFATRETGEIADEIIKNNTVILNFENAKADVSKRTIDFISGVVYTNRGKLIKISDDDIFIVLPNNAEMTGEEVVNQLSEIGVTFD